MFTEVEGVLKVTCVDLSNGHNLSSFLTILDLDSTNLILLLPVMCEIAEECLLLHYMNSGGEEIVWVFDPFTGAGSYYQYPLNVVINSITRV